MVNMGSADRWVRLVAGSLVLIAGIWHTWGLAGPWAIVANVVGVVLILTSLVGYCPLYSFIGVSTRSHQY